MSAGRRQALIACAVLVGACGKDDLAIRGTGEAAAAQAPEPYPARGAVRLPAALAALDLEGPEDQTRAVAGELFVASDTDRPGYRQLPRVRNVGARIGEVFGYPYVVLHFADDVRERATVAWGRPATCTSGPRTHAMWLDPAARVRAWTAGTELRTLFLSAYTPISALVVDPQELPAGRQRLLGTHRDQLERSYGRHFHAAGDDTATVDLPPTEWSGGQPLRVSLRLDDGKAVRVAFELRATCQPSAPEDYLARFARAWGEPRRRDKELVYRTRDAKIVVEPDRDQRVFDVRIEL